MTTVTDTALAPTDEMLGEAMLWRQRMDSGEWSIDDEVELEIWLQADDLHAAAFEKIGHLCGFFDQHAASPELIGARRALLGRVHRESRGRWTGPAAVLRAPSRRLAAAAAVVIILAGLGAWSFLSQGDVYRTGLGERRTIVLADGSVLSLDALSRVSVRYSKSERRLTLRQGQARFDVAHDTSRPFSVAVRDRTVVATGTAFNIDMFSPEVRVTLIEGRVLVLSNVPQRPLSAPHPTKPAVELREGQGLVARDGGQAKLLGAVDVKQAVAWQQGQLMFVGEPLGQAVERINRYTDRKVIVADARAAAIPISGAFNAGDTGTFVEAVADLHPVRATNEPNGIILRSIQSPG